MPLTDSSSYSYSYRIETHFLPPIRYHFFKLRAIPCENACQHLIAKDLSIMPACSWKMSSDGFGNQVQYGGYGEEHDRFCIRSCGVVECTDYRLPESEPNAIYRFESKLTQCDAQMREWLDAALAVHDYPLPELVLQIMHLTHGLMTYMPGATNNATTAQQAFALHQGVCQDYAHLMIAFCRHRGLLARYVNGFMPGEGATHAWVEVHDGTAWLGYDPTHDLQISRGYIKLAHGRDVSDCPLNRGRIYGWTQEELTVSVGVTLITL